MITKGYGVQARYALHKFHVTDSHNERDTVIRLRMAKGLNARDQIAFCAFHSFFVEVQTNNCWLHKCDACVITIWRLRLRAPLVARN